jgi:hypothetical protein
MWMLVHRGGCEIGNEEKGSRTMMNISTWACDLVVIRINDL